MQKQKSKYPLRHAVWTAENYDSVHPSYGTPEDFRKVLESAHRMADASL